MIGVFLNGGFGSESVLAHLCSGNKKISRCLTFKHKDSKEEDIQNAQRLAEIYNVPHEVVELDSSVEQNIVDRTGEYMGYVLENPVEDENAVVSGVTKEDIPVADLSRCAALSNQLVISGVTKPLLVYPIIFLTKSEVQQQIGPFMLCAKTTTISVEKDPLAEEDDGEDDEKGWEDLSWIDPPVDPSENQE